LSIKTKTVAYYLYDVSTVKCVENIEHLKRHTYETRSIYLGEILWSKKKKTGKKREKLRKKNGIVQKE
jgi:hypothetical protein